MTWDGKNARYLERVSQYFSLTVFVMSKTFYVVYSNASFFFQVRYMNYAGCKRKFKVAEFVSKYDGAAKNAAQAMKAGNKKLAGKKRKAS